MTSGHIAPIKDIFIIKSILLEWKSLAKREELRFQESLPFASVSSCFEVMEGEAMVSTLPSMCQVSVTRWLRAQYCPVLQGMQMARVFRGSGSRSSRELHFNCNSNYYII